MAEIIEERPFFITLKNVKLKNSTSSDVRAFLIPGWSELRRGVVEEVEHLEVDIVDLITEEGSSGFWYAVKEESSATLHDEDCEFTGPEDGATVLKSKSGKRVVFRLKLSDE